MAGLDESAGPWQHYQANEREQSERLCWEALRLQPLDAASIYLLGVLALDANRVQPALLHFHHASVLQPQQADYRHALGEAFRAWGGLDEAAAAFRAALPTQSGACRRAQFPGASLVGSRTDGRGHCLFPPGSLAAARL